MAFLQDASDRFEIEERDPPSLLLQELESDASTVIGIDWYKRIDRVVANDLGKYRKYDGKRVRDLLRALRNKVILFLLQLLLFANGFFLFTCRNIIGKIYHQLLNWSMVNRQINSCIISQLVSLIYFYILIML